MFKKANPGQAFFKMSIYGPPGSGKTLTALMFAEGLADGKKIAMVDTERGSDFYTMNVPERTVHPKAFEFDALYTRSLRDVLIDVKGLDSKEYGVVIIDSISHMWEAAIGAYEGKKTKIGTIPMQAWGRIKRPYKELVKTLMDGSFHVFILGRQKNVFDNDEADPDKLIKVGVTMKAEGETPYEPHLCARMEAKQSRHDQSVSTYFITFEKDRTGVLSGKTYENPTFRTIAPVLPLLKGEQAKGENIDDVTENDAQLMDELESLKKDKELMSQEIFDEVNSNIIICKDLIELGTVGAEMKKLKKKMTEEHVNAIRGIYERKQDKISEEMAPKF